MILDQEGQRFAIAVEHVAWASADGQTPREVILAVGQALPTIPTWADVIYALVYEQIAMERVAGAQVEFIRNPRRKVRAA